MKKRENKGKRVKEREKVKILEERENEKEKEIERKGREKERKSNRELEIVFFSIIESLNFKLRFLLHLFFYKTFKI